MHKIISKTDVQYCTVFPFLLKVSEIMIIELLIVLLTTPKSLLISQEYTESE